MKNYPDGNYGFYADKLTERFGLQFTYHSVRNYVRRNVKGKIAYMDRKNESEKVEDLIALLLKSQEELQKYDDRQTEIMIDIDDEKPIGIAFTGDWHTGGLYTAHKQMLKDFAVLKDTDGLYNVTMGDYNDNYNQNSHKGGMWEQILDPDKQKIVTEYMFTKFLGEKNLAVLKGNHDNWEVKETGEDFVRYLARKIGSPYLWYGGTINLRLGNQVYKIQAHHSYKYNSSLNTTNSQRNLFNFTHADIIALAHLHYNETHAKTAGGKDTVWIRTGSYKITDDYSQWVGGFNADCRVPMVVLFPKEKKIVDFRDMYEGIKYLKVVRSE